MNPPKHFAHTSLTTACVAALLLSAHASAQAQSEPVNPQKIEITGSRIKRIDSESSSPVTVLRREELQATGATTLREMLDSVAGSSGGLSDIGGSNSFAPGASSASLRNLGKQSTLVLLNGRRIAAYPLADYSEIFSNIDSLPADAVERIEILKSGGSSIYGSDAVAGVINIITRSDFQGLQVDYSRQQSVKTGDFKSQNASLTGGFGSYEQDGFNLLGNLEVYHRDSLFWREVLDQVNPKYAQVSSSFGSTSTYAYPGNVIGVGPVDGCTTVVSGLCRYDRYSRFQAVPGSDRVNGLISGRFKLSEGKELYTEALLSNTKTRYESAYQTYGAASSPITWTDPSTLQPLSFIYRGLPSAHPLNPTGDEVEFRYRFADTPSYQKTDTDQYRVLAGIKGVTGAWDWDTAVGAMGGTTKSLQRGSFSNSGFKKLVGDYKQDTLSDDFFNKAGGYKIGQANSEAVMAELFPVFGYRGETRQYFLDGKATTELGKLDGGAIQLATGFDLRHESMKITPTSNLASGDIVGYGVSSSSAARSFGALFAEANLPVTKELEASLASRLDKFPGFGAHLSPKLGLRYQPDKAVMLRATAETGFRAPNLSEAAESTKLAFANGVSDPARCAQATKLANDLETQAGALPDTDPNKSLLLARADQVQGNECSAGVANITANNPSLKPETSKSFTLGAVLQLADKWGATIDYWRIERKNEINTKSTEDLLTEEDSLPAGQISRGSLSADPTFTAAEQAAYGVTKGALVSLTNRFENLFKTQTSGVDLSIKGVIPTPLVPIKLNVDATYTINYKAFSAARNAYGYNLAGRYGYPKWQLTTDWTVQTGPLSHNLRWAYRTGTRLVADFSDDGGNWSPEGCDDQGIAASDCRIKSYNRWDYHLGYEINKSFNVGMTIRNLFQQRPPVDYRDFGGASGIIPTSLADAEGRTLKVTASYRF